MSKTEIKSKTASSGKGKKRKKSAARRTARKIGRFFLVLLETVLLLAIGAYAAGYMVANGPSDVWRNALIGLSESSAAKFVPRLYFSEDEISSISDYSEEEYAPTDTGLITISTEPAQSSEGQPWTDSYGFVDEDGDGIIIDSVKGRAYSGYMMIVEDPSRVIMGSIPSSYGREGFTVSEFVQHFDGVAGTNAGGFYDPNGFGDGSIPDSVVVVDGQIFYSEYGCRDGIAALDSNHILHVARSMTRQQLIDNDIRYAVCYGPVLISNGEAVSTAGAYEGLNPRTVIGQRGDGAILLLVIDGRQTVSMGANYKDLTEIMLSYGAVNALNLDGGSSSMLWYQDHYVNNSSSVIGIRDIPTSFVVLKEGQSNG